MNVSLVRPGDNEDAASTLRRAAGISEVIDSARGFYPGSLAQTPDGASVPLLG